VLVVSAFCDQPLHGQKTPPIILERDGNLQGQKLRVRLGI